MLDIKFIKENSDLIKRAVEKKHLSFDVDAFLKIDSKRVSMLEEVETLRARQNKATEEIPNADQERRNVLLSEMQVLKLELGQKEDELKEVNEIINKYSKNENPPLPYRIFLNQVQIFELELRKHAIIEDHVLLPLVLELEKKVFAA